MWESAEKFLQKDKYIGPLIKKYGHCTIKPDKKKNYFSTLVEAIVGQQLSNYAAEAIYNRIKNGLGEITPEKVLKTTPGKFRKYGLSKAKVKYLKDLAQRVKSNKLKIKSLDKLSDEEVTKELVAVKGIGVWTTKMFLMFSLARPDIFPYEDLGIRNSMKKLLGKQLKFQTLDKFSLRWKPYRTVASWYLWEILENK